jgi:predicted ATPase
MQLISLYIKKYNHLEEFTIEFKQKLSVIIGVNGSGKSSILEVLAQIFSAAYLNKKTEFSFKLTYELSDFTIVELSAATDFVIKMNHNNKIDHALLPSNIVVYYSGLSDKMEKLCKPHEDKQRTDFKEDNFTQRPFFYYRPENFKMFLLALFAFEFGDTKDFLLKKIQLTGLNRFNIDISKPNFKKITAKSDEFWGLGGVNRDFCDRLDEFSDDKVTDKPSDNFVKYAFNSINNLYALRDYFDGEKQIFERLDMLAYEGMLGELTILLEKQGQILNSDALSEGEKQIIAIRGINDLLINENTLLLFDEPDTYLHPSWQSKFWEGINEHIHLNNAQFIVTTHSPVLLTNLTNGEVHFLDSGKCETFYPYSGRDVHFILRKMGGNARATDIEEDLRSLSFALTEVKTVGDLKKVEAIYLTLSQKIQDSDSDADLIYYKNEIEFLKQEFTS